MRPRTKVFGAVVLAALVALPAASFSKIEWRARLLSAKLGGSLPWLSWSELLRRMGPYSPGVPQVPPRERVTPGEYNDMTEKEHVARYRFAASYCRGKTVADIASGAGYGTAILRETAASVDGYDREPLGQQYIIDLEKKSWSRHYDVIVSFETIEHLANPDFFLDNVKKTAELLILSTPIGEANGENPFHKQVWALAELRGLLEKSFACEYYFQTGERIDPNAGAADYVVAVCTPGT